MSKRKRPAITDEQRQALTDYAAWAGVDWKAKLRGDWFRAGSYWPGEWATMQQLRHTHGPGWLADYTGADNG